MMIYWLQEELGGGIHAIDFLLLNTEYSALYIGCESTIKRTRKMGEKEGRGIWAHLESREVWKSLLPEAEVEEKIRR